MPPSADAGQGLFETLLVDAGRPVELEAHLRRLGASCQLLLGMPLPEATAGLVASSAAGIALGRLRLTVTLSGDRPSVAASAAEVDPAIVFPARESHAAELRTLPVPGGLGAHKWVDRAALERVTEPQVGLLVDTDGSVLEASRANVFVVDRGTVLTPPADGRILPGIAREGLIAVAGEEGIEMREEALRPSDLLAAEEVFLTGSVRGVQRAGALDGVALPAATEISRRLATGLRARWGLPAAAATAATPATAPPPGRPAR